jgi:hypothetical protein
LSAGNRGQPAIVGPPATGAGREVVGTGGVRVVGVVAGERAVEAGAAGVDVVVAVAVAASVVVVVDDATVVGACRRAVAREPLSPHAATVIARSATKQPARMGCTFA